MKARDSKCTTLASTGHGPIAKRRWQEALTWKIYENLLNVHCSKFESIKFHVDMVFFVGFNEVSTVILFDTVEWDSGASESCSHGSHVHSATLKLNAECHGNLNVCRLQNVQHVELPSLLLQIYKLRSYIAHRAMCIIVSFITCMEDLTTDFLWKTVSFNWSRISHHVHLTSAVPNIHHPCWVLQIFLVPIFSSVWPHHSCSLKQISKSKVTSRCVPPRLWWCPAFCRWKV